ncbi:MAG: hypothetical protein AB8I08_16260 [Sandaracinaceae bacterium]
MSRSDRVRILPVASNGVLWPRNGARMLDPKLFAPVAPVLMVLVACGGPVGPPTIDDAGAQRDASTPDAGPALDAGFDAGPGADAGPPTDGGTISIDCDIGEGPRLIVTRDDALHGSSSAVLRLPLRVSGAVTSLEVVQVTETLDGLETRGWTGAMFRGPEAATPMPGDPTPTVVLSAVSDADPAELAECDAAPWDRSPGQLVARIRTDQTGEVDVTCDLGAAFGARGPESLALACAAGVPGWLGDPRMSGVTSPTVFRFLDSQTLAFNSGSTAVDGFVPQEARATTAYGAFPGETTCGSPTSFTTTAGTHQLWRGSTSEDTWTGPVAPGAQEVANYMWQEPNALPEGFCYPLPGPGVPIGEECIRPVVSMTLSGGSSAGPFTWESDIFDCYDLEG